MSHARGRVVAVEHDSKSFIDRAGFNKDMLYGIVEVDVDPTLSISTGIEYQRYDSQGSDGSKTHFPRSANASASWGNYNHENSTYFATLDKYFASDWVAKINFSHRRTQYDAVLGYAVSGRPDPDGGGLAMYASEFGAKPTQNSFDAYLSGPFAWLGRQHELVVGASVSRTRYSGRLWLGCAVDPEYLPVGWHDTGAANGRQQRRCNVFVA